MGDCGGGDGIGYEYRNLPTGGKNIAAMSREERRALIDSYTNSMKKPDQQIGPDGKPVKNGSAVPDWHTQNGNAIVSMQNTAKKIGGAFSKFTGKKNATPKAGTSAAGAAAAELHYDDDASTLAPSVKDGFEDKGLARVDSVDTRASTYGGDAKVV